MLVSSTTGGTQLDATLICRPRSNSPFVSSKRTETVASPVVVGISVCHETVLS